LTKKNAASTLEKVIVTQKSSAGEGAESMAATIGIKIANGEFYSIMEENSSVKKRLILTTVHDRQNSVQIDLFRSLTRTMTDAQYIGSLVVENIKTKPKGEPSIELVISSDENGNITADAIDLDTGAKGEHHSLNVSLRTLDQETRAEELPDFELESNEPPPIGLYRQAKTLREKEKQFPWAAVILIGVALVLLIAALWFLQFGGKRLLFSTKPVVEQPAPATEPPPAVEPPIVPPPPPPPPVSEAMPPEAMEPPPEPPEPAAAPIPPSPPPVIEAPTAPPPPKPRDVERTRPPAPVASYKVPASIPKGGVPYKIRWGDTLWDISDAFYRNPWLYRRIARYNNIRNPDKIVAGTMIRIPPKN
jgi:hypothetical protein